METVCCLKMLLRSISDEGFVENKRNHRQRNRATPKKLSATAKAWHPSPKPKATETETEPIQVQATTSKPEPIPIQDIEISWPLATSPNNAFTRAVTPNAMASLKKGDVTLARTFTFTVADLLVDNQNDMMSYHLHTTFQTTSGIRVDVDIHTKACKGTPSFVLHLTTQLETNQNDGVRKIENVYYLDIPINSPQFIFTTQHKSTDPYRYRHNVFSPILCGPTEEIYDIEVDLTGMLT